MSVIVTYSIHALIRMKERGITALEIEHILTHPESIKNSFDDRVVAEGHVNNRRIRVVYEKENYIKVITVM